MQHLEEKSFKKWVWVKEKKLKKGEAPVWELGFWQAR